VGQDRQDAGPGEIHGGAKEKGKRRKRERERKRLFFFSDQPLSSPRARARSIFGKTNAFALLSFFLLFSLSHTRRFLSSSNPSQYGATVLAIELLGATTVLLYGVNLLLLPASSNSSSSSTTDEATSLPVVSTPYHVRVLVPCYKESLDILRRTVVAARDAPLPLGCAGKTVYLCDDGRDPKKRKWVDALGDPAVVYVSGRQRPAGEMNGEREGGGGGGGGGGGDGWWGDDEERVRRRDWLVGEKKERKRSERERGKKFEQIKKTQPFL